MRFYKYFLDGTPPYLARNYWWAYLWPPTTRFFDQQHVVNAILFGQYKKLKQLTINQLKSGNIGETLQLTCVYGSLTPSLIEALDPAPLHIVDTSRLQLKLANKKTPDKDKLLATRMNVENLGYKGNSFDSIIIFFLLHEMPRDARHRALDECLRVLKPGGRLIITEYAPKPVNHSLHKIFPFRFTLTRLEPFLKDFWQDNIPNVIEALALKHNKNTKETANTKVFNNFFQVSEFTID